MSSSSGNSVCEEVVSDDRVVQEHFTKVLPSVVNVNGKEVDISCLTDAMVLSKAECEEEMADVQWTRDYLFDEVIGILKKQEMN